MNDKLPCHIICGQIKIKGKQLKNDNEYKNNFILKILRLGDIDYFVEDGVVFKGEETVTPCNLNS